MLIARHRRTSLLVGRAARTTAAMTMRAAAGGGPPPTLERYRSPPLGTLPSRYIRFGNPIADILQAHAAGPAAAAAAVPRQQHGQHQHQQQQHPFFLASPFSSSTTSYETNAAPAGGASSLPPSDQQDQGSSGATFPLNLAVWGGELEGIAHLVGQFPELSTEHQQGGAAALSALPDEPARVGAAS
jgi:hypothetical protein